MSGVSSNVEPRRTRRLVVALTITMIALAGCGADGDEGNAKSTSSRPTKTATADKTEPILIKTRMNTPTGKVVVGSHVGGAPFCPGGTIKDKHGTADIGLVDRTITCRVGMLRMGFDPQTPVGDEQRGPWRIISGTGAYDGWQGSSQMVARYDPDDTSEHPTMIRERYRGTVTH